MIDFLKKIYNFVMFKIARFRAIIWGFFLDDIGKKVYIFKGCIFASPKGISIGDYVNINKNTYLNGSGSLIIGKYVLIGPNCQILTSGHEFKDYSKPISLQWINTGNIKIEDDVWIGANVVILKNVTIGRGSIIGANSVVTKDIKPFSIVGGVPAKLIRYRFSENEIEKAKKIKF